jgi:hypothetical protein
VIEQRILIPEKLFVGIESGVNSSTARLTAWGTDTAAKNRMLTVSKNTKDPITINNVPVTGFALSSAWGDEVSVNDPRGFSVYVKLANVMRTLAETGVTNLEIGDPCVWARTKGENILLSIRSNLYQRALVQTEIANSKASWKKAQAGNRVTLTDGTRGTYVGRHHLLMLQRGNGGMGANTSHKLIVGDVPSHVIITETTTSVHSYLKIGTNLKLAQIDATNMLEPSQAEEEFNSYLATSTRAHGFSWHTTLLAGSVTPIDVSCITLKLDQVDVDDHVFINLRHTMLLCRTPSGQLGVLQSVSRNNTMIMQIIDELMLQQNQLVYKSSTNAASKSIALVETMHRDEVEQAYRLMVVYQTASGYQIKAVI